VRSLHVGLTRPVHVPKSAGSRAAGSA
jgi:hypothetical protein